MIVRFKPLSYDDMKRAIGILRPLDYEWSICGLYDEIEEVTARGTTRVCIDNLSKDPRVRIIQVIEEENMPAKTPLQNALDFLDDVKKTLQEKNKAYGDSAANPLRIFSKSDKDEAIKVRIDDKLSRIARGDGSGNEDAIKDLVGYLALLAGMRK